jgi:triphosphoribosyl-dephospho-CoA synthetase
MDTGRRISRLVQEARVSKPANVNRNHNFPDTSLEDLPLSTLDL